jgi:hypothetical protein
MGKTGEVLEIYRDTLRMFSRVRNRVKRSKGDPEGKW